MKTDRVRARDGSSYRARHSVGMGLLLALGLLVCSCKPEVTDTQTIDATGLYSLVSVDGQKPPAAISHGDARLEVRSGTFTINADGTCRSKMIFVPPSGVESTREVTANYTIAGSRLDMRWQGAGRTTGTLEGNTFTMVNEGTTFVYQR